MNGDKVGERHGTYRAFLIDAVFLSIGEDGQADRHALVAATRVDDDGHLTAAHTGIRTRRGPGTGLDAHVCSKAHDGAADVGAPVVLQTFLRDGFVAFHLRLYNGLEVFNVDGVGEVVDSCPSI